MKKDIKYSIAYKCGHKWVEVISGKTSQREISAHISRALSMPCPKCEKEVNFNA